MKNFEKIAQQGSMSNIVQARSAMTQLLIDIVKLEKTYNAKT